MSELTPMKRQYNEIKAQHEDCLLFFRLGDFYDAYILASTQRFDKAIFKDALKATAAHRGTEQQISDVPSIIRNIEDSSELKAMWNKYRRQFAYAADIEYDAILSALKALLEF